MRMSFWQKCTIVLLGIAIFGAAAYTARVVFRPEGLAPREESDRRGG